MASENKKRRSGAVPPFMVPDESIGVHLGRERFFQAVHQVEPRVAGELRGAPLSLYQPLFADRVAALSPEQRPWPRFAVIPWTTIQHTQPSDPRALMELRDWLLRWSRRWRLWEA